MVWKVWAISLVKSQFANEFLYQINWHRRSNRHRQNLFWSAHCIPECVLIIPAKSPSLGSDLVMFTLFYHVLCSFSISAIRWCDISLKCVAATGNRGAEEGLLCEKSGQSLFCRQYQGSKPTVRPFDTRFSPPHSKVFPGREAALAREVGAEFRCAVHRALTVTSHSPVCRGSWLYCRAYWTDKVKSPQSCKQALRGVPESIPELQWFFLD